MEYQVSLVSAVSVELADLVGFQDSLGILDTAEYLASQVSAVLAEFLASADIADIQVNQDIQDIQALAGLVDIVDIRVSVVSVESLALAEYLDLAA